MDEALAETADAPQASAEEPSAPEESGDGKIDASQLLGDKR